MSSIQIVTLQMEEAYQTHFNALRELYFPAHANYLDAHITLFYHLPLLEPAIAATLQEVVQRGPIRLTVEGIINFGKGVAYRLVSDELQILHQQLQKAFDPWLIKQDRQPLRPHITVQNKVTAFKAQYVHQALLHDFVPFEIMAIGLQTWRYLHGPWKALATYPFHK
ncbi:2'-5' RNA ligase family protein [Chitinophaga ginsengisoli]|uniref:2'-5' RNA ligase superfamily protein n=1 Tax=Chitinophaga ginsengisoli TaxID=363837 RepID=A0A2P8FX82_9BACT|nr:2'-5' RNA ligase family protein [Chitinophaga ginsengisoli]PSL26324.1 2'-5' RNA ligase superfamily protein [Chitinophaga ginsengisoli]